MDRNPTERTSVRSALLNVALIALPAIALTALLAGCSPAPPSGDVGEAPDGGKYSTGPRWRCDTVEGEPDPAWLGHGEGWTSQAGVLTTVVMSDRPADAARGCGTRLEAVKAVADSAVAAGRRQLAARGIPLPATAGARHRAAHELATTGSAGFPRVRFASLRVERCTHDGSDEAARYRAAALVEYPVGLLRGDVTNATWERSRLVREADVHSAAAEEYLALGRWADASFEVGRARDALHRAGARPEGSGDRWVLDDSVHVVEVVPPLSASPEGIVTVVPQGVAGDSRLSFIWTYEAGDRRVPAVGVPVEFEHRLVGIIERDAATDSEGRAGVTVRRTWSAPGSYVVTAALDSVALARAGARWSGPAPMAASTIYVVEAGHGASVCVDLPGAAPEDAAQVRAGFGQRLESDGYDVGSCGPEIDLLVTATLSLSVVESDGTWSVRATLAAETLDQNSALDVGRTEIVVEETTDRGHRETEVLVLKEAGRLLAVYLSGRSAPSR